MGRKNTAGTAQLGAEIDAALLTRFKATCKRNGTTLRFELEDAMRRHLAYPPEREPEPLPARDDEEQPTARKKGRA